MYRYLRQYKGPVKACILDWSGTCTELQERNEESRKKLEQAGAHYVIDTISDLPNVVKEINNRMTMGDAL